MSSKRVSETSKTDGPQLGPTVYFDGSCPLCSAEIRHYASRENGHRLNFVDVSQNERQVADDLDCSTAMRRFHVRKVDGTLTSGAAAFVEIWDALPGWAWLARFARLPGVIPILEVGYRLFLPVRPALSRVASWLGAHPFAPKDRGS